MMKKKLLALLLAASLMTAFTACADNGDQDSAATTAGESAGEAGDTTAAETEAKEDAGSGASVDGMALETLMDAVITGSGQEFGGFFATHPVTAEDVGMFLGTESFEEPFAEALGYAPMVGSIAFQMILFRLPEDADAEAFAGAVKENTDPRKWVCVEAESVETAIRGRTVLFVMADTATTEALINAFHAASPEA